MREIKFRGKDDNGNWHFGDLSTSKHFPPQIVEGGLYTRFFFVDPATVGQFTGLLDSNEKEIYEGDIIQVVTKNPYWAFKKNYDVYWDLDGFCLEGEPLYYWFKLHDLKVIGNVHDNPELLNNS